MRAGPLPPQVPPQKPVQPQGNGGQVAKTANTGQIQGTGAPQQHETTGAAQHSLLPSNGASAAAESTARGRGMQAKLMAALRPSVSQAASGVASEAASSYVSGGMGYLGKRLESVGTRAMKPTAGPPMAVAAKVAGGLAAKVVGKAMQHGAEQVGQVMGEKVGSSVEGFVDKKMTPPAKTSV